MSIFNLAIWDFSGRIANYFVVFLVSVILTRLLSPTEFGAFGIVVSIISLSTVFLDLGFRSAIIQAAEISQQQLSTIFYINLFLAFVLMAVFFFSAKAIEDFYQISFLGHYIIGASSIFGLLALNLIPSGLLQKDLKLKTISIINTVSAFLSGALAVSFAYFGYKVWSLIIQQITFNLLVLIFSVYFAGWYPSFSFSLSSIKKLWDYGSKLLASGLLDTVFTRMDVIIIGKIFPIETLGFYNRAQALDGMVRSFSSGTTSSVAFPLFAKMSDDYEGVRIFYRRSLDIISFISFLLIGVLFLTCFDLVIILFTEKWLLVGNYFRIMAVTGFVYPISALMITVLSGLGNSKAFLKLEAIKKSILFPVYLSFLVGGIYLFLVALGIAFIFALIANAIFVQKEIAVSLSEQMRIIFKYGILSTVCTSIAFVLTFWIDNIYIHLVAVSIIFCGFYFLFNYLFKLPGFIEVFNKINNLYYDKRHANISSAS